ncbi:hypothetical protein IMW82_12875 [Rhodanobacter sp. B2A1Ga4]|uniref:energy transducer TonB n=1 Tax=Rhodanobacter sp. B2A1Ga4 TaxID=2778647 RepID=UPI001B392DAB|nr:hypothetical protein [Rhodanobacter sp. B2A1Ga4]MBQ4855564.1 hypothetical protein [Rhodanobacter sp. B2A1Ga4]
MLLAHLILLAQITHRGVGRGGCGLQENRAIVEKTRAMILHDAPLDSLVGEFPTPGGTPECARVVFSIGGDGHPVDVRVVESSGNVAVNMAVVRSVKKYVMKKELPRWFRTYMLVFRVDDNKMPPNYVDGMRPNQLP